MAERILVVDDEEVFSEILTTMLRKAGYECQTAASGMEALALLRSGEQFDLISSDIAMAEMDGPALLEHVKAEFPAVPLVFASSIADPEFIQMSRNMGASDYLVLPCDAASYVAMIRKALDRHRNENHARGPS